jgi:hypothetical protein
MGTAPAGSENQWLSLDLRLSEEVLEKDILTAAAAESVTFL